jgi:hypothetical protein
MLPEKFLAPTNNLPDEETDNQLFADTRDFYKVDKWTNVVCFMPAAIWIGRGTYSRRRSATGRGSG